MERAPSYRGTIRECSTTGIAENGVRIDGNCASYLDIIVKLTLIALETRLFLSHRAFVESTLKFKSIERLEATVLRKFASTILLNHVVKHDTCTIYIIYMSL